MRLTDQEREQLFIQAKNLHSMFGDVFQNPMDIETEMLSEEFDKVDLIEMETQLYVSKLKELETRIKEQELNQ